MASCKEYLSCDVAANIKEKHVKIRMPSRERERERERGAVRSEIVLDAGRRIYCIFHVHNEPILRSSNPISQWPFGDATSCASHGSCSTMSKGLTRLGCLGGFCCCCTHCDLLIEIYIHIFIYICVYISLYISNTQATGPGQLSVAGISARLCPVRKCVCVCVGWKLSQFQPYTKRPKTYCESPHQSRYLSA